MNLNNNTLKRYDEIVEQYVKTNIRNKEVEIQSNIFISMLNGKKILDVGCGFGRDTNFFSLRGLDCIGIDASEGMLKKANTLYPENSFCKFNLLEDNYYDLGVFDGVWVCASLLHFDLSQIRRVLRRLRGLLTEEGVLYLSVKTFSENGSYEDSGRYFYFYSQETLENLFEELNFKIEVKGENSIDSSALSFNYFFLKK